MDNNYCDELSGDVSILPEWIIKRVEFLEGVIKFERRSRAPLEDNICPKFINDEDPLSCHAVKFCYSYLCDGSCGECNEIWVTDKELKEIQRKRDFERG